MRSHDGPIDDGLVIGTAGHIDHGKTSLIRALTGMDTDRLAEEKRRGISIDLGFAYLTLPNGSRISLVDVPGHERFIKNMLAGVGGIEAVILIVAANESVKPQTREHFEICRLLGIEYGLVALSKVDIASSEQVTKARRDIQALCAGSFLQEAPFLEVSAQTGQGLAELKSQLTALAGNVSYKDRSGLARLPIDRSFALRGFGTVVTGTLRGGALRRGQTVQLVPGKREARIRGLQVHGQQVEMAFAGQRTAVNLTGIDHSEIQRGLVLTSSDEVEATKLLDVSVEWLEQEEIPSKREEFLLHTGTAETVTVLKTFSGTLARLWLAHPVLVLPGDRFVLRRPSPAKTVAGGTVVDTFPPGRLNRAKALIRLERLVDLNVAGRLQVFVEESTDGRRIADLVKRTGLPAEELKAVIAASPALVFAETAGRVVTKAWVDRRRQMLLAILKDFHAKNPGAAGLPMAFARMKLEPNLAAVIFDNFATVRVEGDLVSLATHKAQISNEDTHSLERIEFAFRQGGFQPPLPSEVLKAAGADAKKGRGMLEALLKANRLVRVSEDVIFHAEVVSHIRKSLAAHKGRKFSVPEFKEWTQISRKYAIPLLEYLDRQHVTRREGDGRVVL
jgi:selenocysteine-specific elongation factor